MTNKERTSRWETNVRNCYSGALAHGGEAFALAVVERYWGASALNYIRGG